MKTTMDLPDTLYRRVKSHAAAQGRSVRDVTIELFEEWLAKESPRRKPFDRKQWLQEWRALGARISAAMPPDTDLQDELQQSRNRLEPE